MILTKKQRESLIALPIKEPKPTPQTNYYYRREAVATSRKLDDRTILEINYFKQHQGGEWILMFREFYFSAEDYYQQADKTAKLSKGITPYLLKREAGWETVNADTKTINAIVKFFKIKNFRSDKTLWFFKNWLTMNRPYKGSAAPPQTGVSMEDISALPIPEGLAEFAREWKEDNDFVGIMKAKSHHKYPCTCQHCGGKFNAYRGNERYWNRYKVPSITIPEWGYWNKKYMCPHCGNDIELLYYNDNDYRTIYAENISFFQKINGVLVLRTFHIKRDEEATLVECNRYLMGDNTNEHHRIECSYDWYKKEYYNPRWERYSRSEARRIPVGLLYKPSIQELKFTKYDAPLVFDRLQRAEDRKETTQALQLLAAIKPKNAYIMTLYKKGYTALADDIVLRNVKQNLNKKGKTVAEILRMDADSLQKYGDRAELTFLKIKVCNMLTGCSKPSETYEKIERIYENKTIDTESMEKAFKLCKPQKIVNYTLNQGITFREYLDLINQYERLGFTITENLLYPRSYNQVHLELIELENARKSEKEREELRKKNADFKKAIKKYLKMAFQADGLKIEVIKSATELKAEAVGMHNCSAGYADRIIDGRCAIFKIRQIDKPNQYYCMLELSADYKVVQCYGVRNTPRPEGVDAFLEKWKSAKFKKTEAA